MITYSAGGRLGNQLFQYISARLLAEKIGFHLGTDWTWNDTVSFTKPVNGSKFENDPVTIVETLHTQNLFGRQYDNRHYHLQGYWQNADYYIPNKRKILKYFNQSYNVCEEHKKDIVMHVRLGDYKQFGKYGNVLNQKYYFECLKREKFDQLYIVTDEPNSDYFDIFNMFYPMLVNFDEKESFNFLTKFNRIIIGNSTFSWWASFLSSAQTIYTPKCWVRNCDDLTHNLTKIGIEVNAGFLDY